MLDTPQNQLVIEAAAICDAAGVNYAPGAIWLRADRSVVQTGPIEAIERRICAHFGINTAGWEEVGIVPRVVRPHQLLIPLLVNAHTHLDLTHLGPCPFDGDFISWVDHIRAGRRDDELGIREATEQGIELARRGGTVALGDIAGVFSTVPFAGLRASGLLGTSYIEFFGQGKLQPAAIARMQEMVQQQAVDPTAQVRLGLQPHAPYSAGLAVFKAAVGLAKQFQLPLSTHLAETLAEIEFTTAGTGPQAELIKRLGKWDKTIAGSGRHPVDHLAEILESSCKLQPGWVLAHLNYIDDKHLAKLANWNATVAYCPRASAYFGHEGHRYRGMLAAGINVALGTDSIIGLDTPRRISIIDEMRFLRQRDRMDAPALLRMATINGARGLGIDERIVTFTATGNDDRKPVPLAGVIALPIDLQSDHEPLEQALDSAADFEVIWF